MKLLIAALVSSSMLGFPVPSSFSSSSGAAQAQPEKQEKKEEAKPTGMTGKLTEEQFKALHELSKEKLPPNKGKMIKINEEGAYLTLPEGAIAPLPGVVVIHEWWGLNDHIKHWADRLAGEGYAVLAVDMYRGKLAESSDEAMKLIKECRADEKHMVAVLTAGERFLREDDRIKAPKTGSVGWCLGGFASQLLAINAPELDACAIYYGGGITTDTARLSKIKANVIGFFGSQDQSIPQETVTALDDGLTKVGLKHQIHVYDAQHGFGNPSSPRYDRKSAGDAWDKLRVFFAENLKGEKPAEKSAEAGGPQR